jgi:hypothetical protein
MTDPYQRGEDTEWLKHSNEELSRLLKKEQRRATLFRSLSVLLLALLAWVVYKFTRLAPLEALWRF